MVIVARKCAEVLPKESDGNRYSDSQPLREFRTASAYVLLGDPGLGKTTEFMRECEELGEGAEFLTARDFFGLGS